MLEKQVVPFARRRRMCSAADYSRIFSQGLQSTVAFGNCSRHAPAFTLIELLIVVAIIAILAAIAVPNFMEAQIRSKIARTRNDLRVLDTALNAYRVDYNRYPYPRYVLEHPDHPEYANLWEGGVMRMYELTTPTAYLSSMNGFRNIFGTKWLNVPDSSRLGNTGIALLPIVYGNYDPVGGYFGSGLMQIKPNSELSNGFCLYINGPTGLIPPYYGPVWEVIDQPSNFHPDRYIMVPYGQISDTFDREDAWASVYDPTNGTMSAGMIFRFGGEVQGPPQ